MNNKDTPSQLEKFWTIIKIHQKLYHFEILT